jgi:hypothetical protein
MQGGSSSPLATVADTIVGLAIKSSLSEVDYQMKSNPKNLKKNLGFFISKIIGSINADSCEPEMVDSGVMIEKDCPTGLRPADLTKSDKRAFILHNLIGSVST